MNGLLYYCLFLWFPMTCDISVCLVKMRVIHSTEKAQRPWSEPTEGRSAAAISIASCPSPCCWFALVSFLCPSPVEASIKSLQRGQCDMTSTNCNKTMLFVFFFPKISYPSHIQSNTKLYTYTVLAHVVSSTSERQRTLFTDTHSSVNPIKQHVWLQNIHFPFSACLPLLSSTFSCSHQKQPQQTNFVPLPCPLHLLWSHQLTSYSLSLHSFISSWVFLTSCSLTPLLGALSFTHRFSAACFMHSVHITVSSANIWICFPSCPVPH